MKKEIITLLLDSVKKTNSVGPKIGNHNIGERVIYAMDKELIDRTNDGNFVVTKKGEDLLNGKLEWDDI